MVRCHNCGGSFTTAEASGIVARGKASVSFDDDGIAILTSPIRLEWMVKPGKETEGMRFNITCPHCHIIDPAKLFQVVRSSMMSGGEANTTVMVAGFLIPVIEDEVQAAQELADLLPSIHDNVQDHIEAAEMISSHHASNSSRPSRSKRPAPTE